MSPPEQPIVDQHPDREARRLAALRSIAMLDTVPEADYDSITALAARMLDMPHAFIALMDSDRLWYKSRYHLPMAEMPRGLTFCNTTIADDAETIIDDLTLDHRLKDQPMVANDPRVRFYAGSPIRLTSDDGEAWPIGTLCVLDTRPRTLSEEDRAALRHLADLAQALVAARATARRATAVAKLAEEQSASLRRHDIIFREAERMAAIGSWRLDPHTDHLDWSDGVYRIHELPVGDIPPLAAALDYYPVEARAQVSAALADTLATGTPFDVEADFITAKGNRRRVRSRGELESVDGVPVAIIGVFQDVTDHHALAMQLRRSADIDELTGIANRAAFNRTLAAAINTARVTHTPLLLALIDLDGFKAINDTLGHLAGDDVLRATGRRLQEPWLGRHYAARLGGDEFAVIIDDPALARDPVGCADRLQAALCQPVSAGGLTIATAGTVGTALLGRHDSLRDFVHAADTDLYAAKRCRIGGRGNPDRLDAA